MGELFSFKKNERQVLWDYQIIDKDKTTASLKLNRPTIKELVLTHDLPWEGDGCNFHNIFKDGDIYRMYYLSWNFNIAGTQEVINEVAKEIKIYAAYAESRDGLNWIKPNLGIIEYNGSKNNNIIMDDRYTKLDNFFVFKDPNPNCPKNELYKAVVRHKTPTVGVNSLWCYTSADAIHFEKAWIIQENGMFDTLNVAFWDAEEEIYRCYIRGFHGGAVDNTPIDGRRDIRYIESKDFKTWSEPVHLKYQNDDDVELYTNNVSKYYRANNIFIGFPSRYIERKPEGDWTANYERLCGRERRKLLIEKTGARHGTVVTDCLFMTSRDGVKFNRFDEAYLTPEGENGNNWFYGDCYPSYGMIETKDEFGIDEISMYVPKNHMTGNSVKVYRYTIRLDGFASFNSGYTEKKLTTKPFKFEGDTLEINFKTSAAGHIYVNILDEKGNALEGYQSCEIFGDSASRIVDFDKSLNDLSGKNIRIEFLMSDADMYSFVIK